MKKLVLSLGIVALISCSPAMAARNENGAMLLHTNDACSYSAGWDYCGNAGPFSAPLPTTCDQLVTTTTKDPNVASIIWMVAAFPDSSTPGVRAFQVGLYGDVTTNWFSAWSFCPVNGLEIPDPTWPGPGSGTAVEYLGAAVTSRLFKMYYFACGAPFTGAIMRTGGYPHGDGYAAFADDSWPAMIDYCRNFGTMGWGVPGSKNCPTPPTTGACCFLDGHCETLEPTICTDEGGVFLGLGTYCDPGNPCVPRACCLQDGHCVILNVAECHQQGGVSQWGDCYTDRCLGACCISEVCVVFGPTDCDSSGGTYQGYGTLCDPNPCPTSSVESGSRIPSGLALSATPNPSTGQIRIAYELPRAAAVTIEIFSAAGALVRRMEEGPLTAGHHAIDWDGRDSHGNALPSGVYLARIVTGEGSTTQRVVLAR